MQRKAHWLPGMSLTALLVAGVFTGPCAGQIPDAWRKWAGRSSATTTRKVVTADASFAAYVPSTWRVVERTAKHYRTITLTGPGARCRAELSYGRSPAGRNVWGVVHAITRDLDRRHPRITLSNARQSRDGMRIVFDGHYRDGARGEQMMRCWVALHGNDFVCSRIEAPAPQFAAKRRLLLSILANVKVLKGGFGSGLELPSPQSLTPYRLRDGSASFRMPRGWRVKEFGKAQFWATDPTGTASFVAARVNMLTPRVGSSVPGVIISPYRAPHRAQQFLLERQRLMSGVRFQKVIPRGDVVREMGRVYTLGTVQAEEFVYTGQGPKGSVRAYTFGIGFYSRLGTNWTLCHFTVAAPADRFESMVPMFIAMLGSFKVDEEWLANYLRQGAARLRQMARDTTILVRRNADEIRRMNTAAYNERVRSQEYIDYQRTSYIRGTQDWISEVEGGTVYHTDSWGTRNTVTGEFWEARDGRPYDYVKFRGQNPKYAETMTPVNDRRLWERHVQGR